MEHGEELASYNSADVQNHLDSTELTIWRKSESFVTIY